MMAQQIPPIIKVQRMLESLLMSRKKLFWIGGYIYGRTGNDDPFVVLYGAAKWHKEKICKVYSQDFRKLPDFIVTDPFPETNFFQSDSRTAVPDREGAIKKGIYFYCPMFQIVRYAGEETQFGREQRFYHVLAITSKTGHVPLENGQANGVAKPGQSPLAQPPADSRGEMAPTAQAQRKPSIPQTPEFEFYTAVFNANNVIYPDPTSVKAIAGRIDDNWRHGESATRDVAMGNALDEYAKVRADLQDAGNDTRTCHNNGLQKAIEKYTAVVESA